VTNTQPTEFSKAATSLVKLQQRAQLSDVSMVQLANFAIPRLGQVKLLQMLDENGKTLPKAVMS